MKLFIIASFLFTASCKNDAKIRSKINVNNLKWDSIRSHMQEQYINISEIKGLTLEEIITKYKPIQNEEFYLNEGPITEFRIGLYNFFNEEERHKPVLIREITWKKSISENYTAWFKMIDNNWISIDSYVWNKDSEF